MPNIKNNLFLKVARAQVMRAARVAVAMVAAVWAAEPATGRDPMLAAQVAVSPLKTRRRKQSR